MYSTVVAFNHLISLKIIFLINIARSIKYFGQELWSYMPAEERTCSLLKTLKAKIRLRDLTEELS